MTQTLRDGTLGLSYTVECSERSVQKGTFAKDCGELEALVGWRVDTRVTLSMSGKTPHTRQLLASRLARHRSAQRLPPYLS